MADKVGQNVSDTLKKAQVSLLRGQYKAKEQTRKATDAVKGFGERISGAFKSLFGGSRKHRRHIKRRRSAKEVCHHFAMSNLFIFLHILYNRYSDKPLTPVKNKIGRTPSGICSIGSVSFTILWNARRQLAPVTGFVSF